MLWFLIGIVLPTLIGWLLIGSIEGSTPVLGKLERIALAFVLGLTFAMFVMFLVHIAGLVAFTRMGFLSVQIGLIAIVGMVFLLFRSVGSTHAGPAGLRIPPTAAEPSLYPERPPSSALLPTPRWLSAILILLTLWTILKVITGSVILVTTPSSFDDTLKNWNLRGKIFYQTHALTLSMDPSHPDTIDGLSSYPPTVSMAKAWLASLAGEWQEGLVNAIHIVWFLALILLVYGFLRRHTSWHWAILGVYLLVSIPLVTVHGLNAYAEIFLSAHLFAAATLLFSAISEQDAARRASFFRLSALALSLLVFTKNEALVLYLPILLMLLVASTIVLQRSHRMTVSEAVRSLLWHGASLLIVILPWISFKITHGLTFGNAKSLTTALPVGWQPGALQALWISLFFEGNWLLLFPLFFLLIAVRFRSAFRSPLVLLVLLVLSAGALQCALFLTTPLSIEAIKQTGFARGILQFVPIALVTTMMLAREVFREEKNT